MAKQSQAVEVLAPSAPIVHGDLVLASEQGTTVVVPEVVAKIAGLAVREVDGVHGLVPFGAPQTLSNLARNLSGADMKDLGVQVEVGQIEAAVDVRIVANYGVSIPTVAKNIRARVEERIRLMTGLKVKEVNIQVVDLWFPEREPVASDAARVR